MDNGAYEKFRSENPVVNTPLSTYDYLDKFVHQLTNAELVVCVTAAVLALFAIYKIFAKSKKTDSNDNQERRDHE
jgi:hypothetical protein